MPSSSRMSVSARAQISNNRCQSVIALDKGKVERAFWHLESNMLNARSFTGLDHLNEITAWWLANVSDVRQHRTTGKTPLELHQQELPYLVPLPEKPYDTAEVLYRIVNSEGYISYRQN